MSRSQEIFNVPSSAAERTCIDPTSPKFAQACGSCMLHQATNSCDILNAGIAQRNLAAQVTALTQERDEEREGRVNDQKDQKIPDFYTINGIIARIRNEKDLAGEFTNGTVGVVYIDLRGLHAKNEMYGNPVGDFDLRESAERLTTARTTSGGSFDGLRLERTGHQKAEHPPKIERRRRPATKRDIGYRGNSADELVVLVRSISPEDLVDVHNRVLDLFSVDRAITDSREGRLPLVASAASAHILEVERDYADPLDLFLELHELARNRHEHLKAPQYAQLWDRTRRRANELGHPRMRKPRDARLIIERFVEICCPDFAANARQFYAKQGVPVKALPQSQRRRRADSDK